MRFKIVNKHNRHSNTNSGPWCQCHQTSVAGYGLFASQPYDDAKMKFNKAEIAALARQPSNNFDKEGVLFVRERSEGLFGKTKNESK